MNRGRSEALELNVSIYEQSQQTTQAVDPVDLIGNCRGFVNLLVPGENAHLDFFGLTLLLLLDFEYCPS